MKRKNKIVMTFGIFDLLHYGHLNLLNEAKKLGDTLIVGVGSDFSVNNEPRKKWKTIMSAGQRVAIINSLKMVDWAFVYGTYEDLEKSIEILKPDVYIRGNDWVDDFPGKKKLQELKIPIKIIPYTKGVSSSEIKEKIKERINDN